MTALEIIQSKIYSTETLYRHLLRWRFLNKKIVFTNGCFDLLHLGHISYLSRSADLGNILIVGLNSDRSVKEIKGPSRPLTDEASRSFVLASLHFVSAVVLFDEPTPIELIKSVQPDILVKGGDYKAEDIAGYDFVKEKGGEVIILDFIPGYSTSALEAKILKSGPVKG